MLNATRLGQVFTPLAIVKKMLELRKNQGSILEPAAGNGNFLSVLEDSAIGIELDKSLIEKNKRIQNLDFFTYPTTNKFQTIIGNPPYVRFQDILQSTKQLLPMQLFDHRSNLYLFFIAKCIEHLPYGGELIFITPRAFLKSTNAKKLNKRLYQQGSFTDFYELGDTIIFNGYSPNCIIWRWEKGRKNKTLSSGKTFHYSNGQIWFGNKKPNETLANYFDVKVGAVSGADHIFSNNKYGNVKMVCSITHKTKETRTMIYNQHCEYLNRFKTVLLNRKVKHFNENNWWKWGRNYPYKECERIYVNCKTRNPKPFFVSDNPAFDGSILALFPKIRLYNLRKVVQQLNAINWELLGFVCNRRFIFSQKSLQNAAINHLDI